MKKINGYFTFQDYDAELLLELGHRVKEAYGRILLADESEQLILWAQNIWHNPIKIPIMSIGDGVKKLKAIQRNWVLYSFDFHRRAQLIQDQLPHVSCKPLLFRCAIPKASLGSWTLLEPNCILASSQCSSAFANGEVHFVEDKNGPPNQAYLKLWEIFTLLEKHPRKEEVCLDLGSSPGGWTWVLGQLGSHVISVDKAPLDPMVINIPNVEYQQQSVFAISVLDMKRVDWLFWDVVCYPERLLKFIMECLKFKKANHYICTIKFQGPTDHTVVQKFAQIPGSKLIHLYHNKHELTWIKLDCLANRD